MRLSRFQLTFNSICCLLTLVASSGCITFTSYAIPADRLPVELRAEPKGERVHLNYALLGQEQPAEYTIAPGDILGVYIKGLLPPDPEEPIPFVPPQTNFTDIYYPPTGQNYTPAVGLPMEVNSTGELNLPAIGPIKVTGLTISQAIDEIGKNVVDKQISQLGREYVYLTLIRRKVERILVIREEVESPAPTFLDKSAPLYSKRGSAQVVDLPTDQNDVLHALSTSGGLPGFDAYNEIWVLRRQSSVNSSTDSLWGMSASPEGIPSALVEQCAVGTATKIPLWVRPCDSPTFGPNDVLLYDGDVVFIRGRTSEIFYTGGLLAAGPVPLPRDHDVDIIEAISLANVGLGGVGGQSGVQVIKTGAGPGNILPPTRALIIRKLPNNQQVAIRVDLRLAQQDRRHRVIIQPQDFVSLHYTPGQIVGNSILNVLTMSYAIPNN